MGGATGTGPKDLRRPVLGGRFSHTVLSFGIIFFSPIRFLCPSSPANPLTR
jgi:hypothetical protein